MPILASGKQWSKQTVASIVELRFSLHTLQNVKKESFNRKSEKRMKDENI